MKHTLFVAALLAAIVTSPAVAGIYSGPTDTTGAVDAAVPAGSDRFVEWADAIDASRTSFAPRGSTSISPTGFNSLGDLSAAEIDAGVEPGRLTVTFPTGIGNGEGADFAVFENGFTFLETSDGMPGLFAEYAYVEVSTDGDAFARFPSIDLNDGPIGPGFGRDFTGFDVTNVYNLAGKHAGGFGTPFDLDDLALDPLVVDGQIDLGDIQFVRLVDIPGNGAFLDSLGNPIVDNHLTTGSGGFDFRLPAGQGVGVLNPVVVPEPALTGLAALAGGLLLVRRRKLVAPVATIGLTAGVASAQTTITFEDVPRTSPEAGNVYNESGYDGFTAGDVEFTGRPFGGWAAATATDTTTPGFGNQFSAFPGSGANGSETFAIASGAGSPINLAPGQQFLAADLTATTYTALSILQGDGFAKKFGGESGDDPDLFTVTLSGYDGLDGTGDVVGTPVTFTIADYRFDDNSLDYVVDDWRTVDLTPLADARSLALTFFSTDVGQFGINTPTYVALDNLVVVPEPASLLAVAGVGGLLLRRRRA